MTKADLKKKNAARLKKMHKLAAAYIKKHPNASYRTAQKEAGKAISRPSRHPDFRPKRGTKSERRKFSSVGTKPKYKVVHEVRKIGKKAVGSMADVRQYKKAGKEILDNKLAWNLLAIESAKNKAEKNRLLKIKRELKREIRALS